MSAKLGMKKARKAKPAGGGSKYAKKRGTQ